MLHKFILKKTGIIQTYESNEYVVEIDAMFLDFGLFLIFKVRIL